jgi:hypothetical protein
MIQGQNGAGISGTTVTIEAESEEAARAAFSAAEGARLKAEGRMTERAKHSIDNFLDDLVGMNDTAMRNTMHIVAWTLLVIGGAFAYVSGSNLWATPELKPVFGAFAIVVVFIGKVAAGRWAKSANKLDAAPTDAEQKKAKGALNTFRATALVCVAMSAALGFALQSANSVNRENGAIATKDQIDDNGAALRMLKAEADEMDRPRETVAQIEKELLAMKSRSAVNYNGANAKFNIGEAVEDGSETYCRGSTYYKNKYCPDLLDLEGALEARRAYRGKLDAIHALEANTTELRSNHVELSSSEAIGKVLFKGEGKAGLIKGMLIGMLLILIIDMLMVGTSYLAHRYPKGV